MDNSDSVGNGFTVVSERQMKIPLAEMIWIHKIGNGFKVVSERQMKIPLAYVVGWNKIKP